ncbi:hypothetical protein MXB_741 [Myxobolus squamalis]|nr:hypothetical protein MXB_741 [Myxobolus squamalis]
MALTTKLLYYDFKITKIQIKTFFSSPPNLAVPKKRRCLPVRRLRDKSFSVRTLNQFDTCASCDSPKYRWHICSNCFREKWFKNDIREDRYYSPDPKQ